METKTLRDLINEHGANGVIRIDDGNGSAGPMWVDWDDDTDAMLGDTEMTLTPSNTLAYNDPDNSETIADEADYVSPGYDDVTMYVSDWIEDDDRNAPYQASNPYHYRLIF